jgi:hypothetical protein
MIQVGNYHNIIFVMFYLPPGEEFHPAVLVALRSLYRLYCVHDIDGADEAVSEGTAVFPDLTIPTAYRLARVLFDLASDR